jgi:hypothetical protein
VVNYGRVGKYMMQKSKRYFFIHSTERAVDRWRDGGENRLKFVAAVGLGGWFCSCFETPTHKKQKNKKKKKRKTVFPFFFLQSCVAGGCSLGVSLCRFKI